MLPIVTLNYALYYENFLHLIQNAETLTQEIDTLILCVVQKKLSSLLLYKCWTIIISNIKKVRHYISNKKGNKN